MGLKNWAKRERRSLLAILMTPALVTALWLASATLVAAEEVSITDKVRLFNQCGGVYLSVNIIDFDRAEKNRLTEKQVAAEVRNRLQRARIYNTEPNFNRMLRLDEKERWIFESPKNLRRLHVYMRFDRPIARIDISLQRVINHPTTLGRDGPFKTTWNKRVFGIHVAVDESRPYGYVWLNLIDLIDEFIEEYLRVNADACK